MRTLQFNRVHKNGWLSYKLTGVPGAVYVDKRMLSADALATPPETIEIDVNGMVEPGADATAAAAAKAAKTAEREAAKLAKTQAAAEKATARLAKLQAAADAAKAKAEAAASKTSAAAAQ